MTKKLKAGIFVDNANLFYAQLKSGWKVDMQKLKALLSAELEVACMHYHIAVPAKWDDAYLPTRKYIDSIKKDVEVIEKPLKYIRSGGKFVKKGDVDVEIVLDVVRNLSQCDLVVVVSGDSDFVALRKYVLDQNKKILFVAFRKNISWEIKSGKYLLLDNFRAFLDLKKKTTPEFDLGRPLLRGILNHKSVPVKGRESPIV